MAENESFLHTQNLKSSKSRRANSHRSGHDGSSSHSSSRNSPRQRNSYNVSDEYDVYQQTPSKLNGHGFSSRDREHATSILYPNASMNNSDLHHPTHDLHASGERGPGGGVVQGKASNLSLASRIALFCPFCSARAIEIGYFGSLLLYIPVQATLAIAWGPHYFGLMIAVVFGIWALVGLTRSGTAQCRFPVHVSIKVMWYLGFFTLMLLSGSFFCIYNITNWNVPIESGFPGNCYKPHACVRIVPDNDNINAQNLTSPIFHNTTREEVMNLVGRWLEIETFETNRLIARNSSYYHARFITVFFGFIDDFYILVNPYDEPTNGIAGAPRRRTDGVQSGSEFLKRDTELAQLHSNYQANEATYEDLSRTGRGSFAISIQSESRLGSSDFGLNYERVLNFLTQIKKLQSFATFR